MRMMEQGGCQGDKRDHSKRAFGRRLPHGRVDANRKLAQLDQALQQLHHDAGLVPNNLPRHILEIWKLGRIANRVGANVRPERH